jgi:hypothetical protein
LLGSGHLSNFTGGAYAEMFKEKYLGRINYDYQKSRVTGPLVHKDLVSEKKYLTKISCFRTFNM